MTVSNTEKSRLDGFLIFLLLIFLVFYAAMNKNRGISPVEKHSKYQIETGDMSAFHKVTLGIPLDINSESVEGLTAIPGIGISLAQKIETERIKRNGFTDINDLKTLPGIGEKLLARIAPYIRL